MPAQVAEATVAAYLARSAAAPSGVSPSTGSSHIRDRVAASTGGASSWSGGPAGGVSSLLYENGGNDTVGGDVVLR